MAGLLPAAPSDYPVADRITLALLAVLRAATLLLGSFELYGDARWRDPIAARWLLAGLTGLSAVTFARAASRVARRAALRPFDAASMVTETVTGVAALLILADATPPAARAGSGFWAEPYTVICAVIIAAAARRAWPGALAVTCLTGAYLLSVLSASFGPPAAGQASVTAAWTNATSYLAFYALAFMGFRLLRNIAGQAEVLRQMIARLAAERTRMAAADRIWHIGHDIPKALLREVRRATMSPEQLRKLAPSFRTDLLALLTADPRAPVHLREELDRIAATYAVGMRLEVDLAALGGQPPGIPALLMAEAARELLNNASYHRCGYPARLTGSSSADHVEISVHNDGPGVDPRRLASAWTLKQNTIHQFETAGGSCHIHSAPASAAGTTVVLRYPGEHARGTTAL
jgi:hypothetical protein